MAMSQTRLRIIYCVLRESLYSSQSDVDGLECADIKGSKLLDEEAEDDSIFLVVRKYSLRVKPKAPPTHISLMRDRIFANWIWIHDMDESSAPRTTHPKRPNATPLYYVTLYARSHGLAERLITTHPEDVDR
jgi:hypothetical protein